MIKLKKLPTAKDNVYKYILYVYPGITIGEIVTSLSNEFCYLPAVTVPIPLTSTMVRTIANIMDEESKSIK